MKGAHEGERGSSGRRCRRETAVRERVMQEQKAENTGRQFCSCFYQLLGIGGPEARPWQDASWGVRVGTYVSLAYRLLSFSLFVPSPRPAVLLLLFLFGASPPFFSVWTGSTIRSSLASTSPRSPRAPFARSSSSSRLAAFGYPLGSSGSPSTVHSLRGMPYIYAR